MNIYLKFVFLALVAVCTEAIKIDCDNPDSINEDHIHYCCKHPDGHNDVLESCAKQTKFKLPNPNEEAMIDITAYRALAATCFAECVFNKYKFMDDDQLDMVTVKKHFEDGFKNDTEYVREMINAFEHCHGKYEDDTARFLSSPLVKNMVKKFCNPKPSVIMACMLRQFFHNCPADRWSKTEECKNVLEFSKKCKDALTTM